MKEYVSPTVNIEELESADVLLASGGVKYEELEGYDTEGSKSAIFDALYWLSKK